MNMEQKLPRMPSIFVGQGAPPLIDHARIPGELAHWAEAMPRPKALLIFSAHWAPAPLCFGSTQSPVPLLYDFGGFPRRFYELQWPAPPALWLVERVQELLDQTIPQDPGRGLDHGVFIPLLCMYPKADIPVIQMSIPSLDPATLIDFGRQLAPLRDEDVQIHATGLITHSFAGIDVTDEEGLHPPEWTRKFDEWVTEKISQRDFDALVDYRQLAPNVSQALPTHEHFVPLFIAIGAAIDQLKSAQYPVTGFWYGNSIRSVQFD